VLSPYCPECPRRYKPIGGDGPQPAEILIVGERPGANENKYQRVFIGKTGQELNETYLPLAGLHRSDVRVCNAVRCWADNNRTPTDKEIASCASHHLPLEIERTRPKIVMLMGGSACKIVPSIKLDTHHGIPQWGRIFDWQGWIVPMYHPALGLHESKWMTQILEDWEELPGRLAAIPCGGAEELEYETDYRIVRGQEVNVLELTSSVAIDTESHGADPFSVQVSSIPGRAYMVLAEDRQGLALLARRLRQAEGIFHNAVHDLDDLRRMGISLLRFRDTMQEAYHLGNLPQGLKPLVYRLFGHTMTSWEDVVRPYSIEALTCWIVEAAEVAAQDLSLIEVKRLKTKIRETVKKGPLESLLIRLLTHVDPTSDYDPWERLDEFWANDANEWMTGHIEARIGRYPILGIANAPLHRAVAYACGDADWTGQVAVELERRRQDEYWRINEGDRDE
jgi:uracil-DNA glycosylase family 4